MARIFIEDSHYKLQSYALTALTLHVEFDGGSAEVSILEIPEMTGIEIEAAIRAVALRLGQAIVQAAQDPQGVVASPRPRE